MRQIGSSAIPPSQKEGEAGDHLLANLARPERAAIAAKPHRSLFNYLRSSAWIAMIERILLTSNSPNVLSGKNAVLKPPR
jgi:hypothetical protein